VRVGPHSVAVDQTHHAGQHKFAVDGDVSLGLAPSQLRWLSD